MVDKVDDSLTPSRLIGELGTTGLKQYGGYIEEEWLRELKGLNRSKVINEMTTNDPIIGSMLFAIEMLIRQVKWRVQAASSTPAAKTAADFLDTCILDMSQSWDSLISSIITFLPHGFSYHEVVYKRRLGAKGDSKSKFEDGKIGWRKIPIRAQETIVRWQFDENSGVQGAWQQDPVKGNEVFIPIERSLLFRTTANKGNPEGKSVVRNAYRPWYFKKRIEEIEGIGIERDLAGLPVIYAPAKIMSASASAADQALFSELKKIVTNIRRDEQEGIIMPGDSDVTTGKRLFELVLLNSGGSRQFNTTEIVGRYEQRMAMTILADFILLGHDKVGSYALSTSKTALFISAIGTWLAEIKSVFNAHAIPKLMDVNGFAEEDYPTLEHGEVVTPDLSILSDFIAKLAGSGVELFPDQELETYLREVAHLPAKTEEPGFEPTAPQGMEGTPPVGEGAPQVGEGGQISPDVPLASTALNGAQVTALREVLRDVVGGIIPKEAASDILVVAFNLPKASADSIVSKLIVDPSKLQGSKP